MNERERKQLETKLRNRLAELDAELEGFRARHRVFQQSDEDFKDGRIARKELVLIAKLLVDFARSAITAAESVSSSRAAFEAAQAAVDQIKGRFAPHIALLGKHLIRLTTDKANADANRFAIKDAKLALVQLDAIVEEADFVFAESIFKSTDQPTIGQLDDWIRRCGTYDGKKAWKLIREQIAIPIPKWSFFDERWKIYKKNKGAGRPSKSEVIARKLLEDNSLR